MLLLRRLDKNGKRVPAGKCLKCGSDSLAETYAGIKFVLLCEACHWCYSPDEKTGFYISKEDKEKYIKNYQPKPAVPLIKSKSKWRWMPFSKNDIDKNFKNT